MASTPDVARAAAAERSTGPANIRRACSIGASHARFFDTSNRLTRGADR
jgi:hypothetical protein